MKNISNCVAKKNKKEINFICVYVFHGKYPSESSSVALTALGVIV